MEFLKELLGEALFSQVEEKINAYNGQEANKDKQVKLGNLGTGSYVGKEKYEALSQQLAGKETELTSAKELIEQLKKATKGDEGLQEKITAYEAENAKLQTQLAETKLQAAVKVALLSEKAVDVDYLTFKLQEKLKEQGETLELDENDNIKGWESRLEGLKTQFPNMFESASGKGGGYEILDLSGLPKGAAHKGLTRAELLKKPYAERMELYNKDPEGYQKAMKS